MNVLAFLLLTDATLALTTTFKYVPSLEAVPAELHLLALKSATAGFEYAYTVILEDDAAEALPLASFTVDDTVTVPDVVKRPDVAGFPPYATPFDSGTITTQR